MKLRNLNFKNFVFGQSGVQGFFGERDEYLNHKWFELFFTGFSFKNMVFVAKTITLKPRIYPTSSNTELRDGYKIKRFFPSSIWFSLKSILKGYLLNAVGLANPGAHVMLSFGKWQERKDTFLLSFMSVEDTIDKKILEAKLFCHMLLEQIPPGKFHKYALQVNFSCPNTGHDEKQDVSDIILILDVFTRIIPDLVLIPKFDLMIDPESIVDIKKYCDAFCISNSLAFGKKQPKDWWKQFFPKGKSPLLKHFGGRFSGGLSGVPLFPLLVDWLEKMQAIDNSVIIIAGGGIIKKKDILRLSKFKIVHGIALGSVAILRPWRLRSLIEYGNYIFRDRELMPYRRIGC